MLGHLGTILGHLGAAWGQNAVQEQKYCFSDVADIAEIDRDKKFLAQIAKKKRRAGAGAPPQGGQSGACPLWAGHAVSDAQTKVAKAYAI